MARQTAQTATQRLARTSMLAATALVLSYLETMIPLPAGIPGIKLGLANIAVVTALFTLDVRSAAAVAAVKVVASGLLFGSPAMLIYSLGGMTCAFAAMVALWTIPGVGLVPVSMFAAVAHNAGQLAVAACVLHTPAAFLNLPVLAVAACITGGLTGTAAEAALESLTFDGEGERPSIDLSGFTIAPGEHVVFIGANGSGKTTAALELAGLAGEPAGGAFVPAAGTAESPNVRPVSSKSLRPDVTVGLAFQDPDSQIVSAVVRDDTAFGLENRGCPRERMLELVADALDAAGIPELARRDVATLSGGQKQRVALAGLLALAPGLVVFDETTSMLDPAARARFADRVAELNGAGVATILITQLMDEAAAAKRIALFDQGRIVFDGSPDELRALPDLLAFCGMELPCR